MDFDEIEQRILEIWDASEDPAIKGAAFELGKPAFHGIHPGGAGRSKMEVNVRPGFQPIPYLLRFVDAVIVEDDVQILAFRMASINLAQERKELFGTGACHDFTDDTASEDVESRVQARSPMPLVVVGPATDPPGT